MDLSKKSPKQDIEHVKQAEEEAKRPSIESEPDSLSKVKSHHIEDIEARSDSSTIGHGEANERHNIREHQIMITSDKIVLPDWVELSEFEQELLEVVQQKLRRGSSDARTEA